MLRKFIPTVGLQDFLVIAGIFGILTVQMPQFASDPGTGWHLKSGEWAMNHGAVPTGDPFLFSLTPRAWVSDQWLSDLILWWLYDNGSWPLLYSVLAVVYCVAFFGVLYPSVRSYSGSAIGATIATLFAFKFGEVHLLIRPIVFGIFLFVLLWRELFGVVRLLRQGEYLSSKQWLWVATKVAVLFIVWSNLHPSFALGILLMVLVLLGTMLDQIFSLHSLSGDRFRNLLCFVGGMAVVAGLATLINPYGFGLHRSIMELGRSDYFMRLHQEWNSPSFHDTVGVLLELSVFVILLAFFLSREFRKSIGFAELLPFLAFLHGTLVAVRIAPFYGVVSAIVVTRALQQIAQGEWVERTPWLRWIADRLVAIELREQRSSRGIVALAVISLLMVGDSLARDRILLFQGPFGPLASRFPYDAVATLRELTAPSAGSTVVAAPPEWGGFITLMGQGALRAVIDDRNTLLGEQFYRDYFRFMRVGEPWRDLLDSFGARYLMIHSGSELAQHIKETGALFTVHTDALASVFDLRSGGVVGEDGGS